MKLIKCYIENFGKLHQFSLHFNDDITVINEQNGFGKTTLAAFIKSMLYGFPKSSKFLEKNDRKKYMPWQGGIYGGYLDFELNGIEYRVEREFGNSITQDKFRLFRLDPYCQSDDLSENLGQEILGLSREGYEKTSYFPQNIWSENISSKELKDKLSDMVENTTNISEFEKACKSIRTKRNELLSFRGKDGLLYKINSDISKFENQINSINTSKDMLEKTQIQLKAAESDAERLKKEYITVRDSEILMHNTATQTILSDQFHYLNDQINKIDYELKLIAEKYPQGFPTDEELKLCSQLIYEYDTAKYDSLEADELSDFFSNGIPGEDLMEVYDSIAYDIQKERNQMDGLHNDHNIRVFFPSFIICSLILLISIGIPYVLSQWNINNQLLFLLPISGVCFAMFVLIIHCYKSRKHNRSCETKRDHHLNIIQQLEEYLRKEMSLFGLYEDDPIDSLDILKAHRNHYIHILSIQKNTSTDVIHVIYDQYDLYDFDVSAESINKVYEDKNQTLRLLSIKKNLEKQISNLDNKYPMRLSSTSDQINIKSKESVLLTKIQALEKDIVNYHKEIAILQTKVSQLSTLEEQLNKLLIQRKNIADEVQLLDKTLEHLSLAYESISGGFILPLKKQFSDYLFEIMNVAAEHIFIDKNISVSLENSGIQRDQAYLSVGECDIIALCMRLALIDILYPNEKPLLILDDPFVNLDANNISRCLNSLDKISKTHQILYLTCHESRI